MSRDGLEVPGAGRAPDAPGSGVGAGSPVRDARSDMPSWYDPDPPTPDESAEPSGGAHGFWRFLTELPVLVLIAFVLALLLKTFLVQAFFIPSSSMEPTLEIGDRVLVNKVVLNLREPQRGEVVVFSERAATPTVERPGNAVQRFLRSLAVGLGLARPDEKDFIKRIIGLPGETLEYRDGVILIDGEPLDELTAAEGGYLSGPDFAPFGPVTIPPGQYFMMGDNRPSSADSRSLLGTIPREDIVGRAFVVIWPVSHLRRLPVADYTVEPAAIGRLTVPAVGEQTPAVASQRDRAPAVALSARP